MANRLKQILRHLGQALPADGHCPTDGQLLARFVATRDETAFAALVPRHGAMVLGVCRRLLRHEQDAEDAFQATFLILARKAGAVRKRESVSSFLYGVAYRIALRARSVSERRLGYEKQVAALPEPTMMPPEPQDWRPLLDRELHALPEKYRRAVVLCDLEGRRRRDAARPLGRPEGTLSCHLARGRGLLAKRLARYGLSLSAGALAAALSEGAVAAVPLPLVSSTTKAAVLVAAGQLAAMATPAAVLTTGVLKAMFLTKLKLAGAVMAAVLVVTGAGTFAFRSVGAEPEPNRGTSAPKNAGKAAKTLETLRLRLEEARLRAAKAKLVLEQAQANALQADAVVALLATKLKELEPPKRPDDLAVENRRLRDELMATRDRLARLEEEVKRLHKEAEDRWVKWNAMRPADPVKEAEAAVKALREAKDKEGRRRATEALEKAVKKLKAKTLEAPNRGDSAADPAR